MTSPRQSPQSPQLPGLSPSSSERREMRRRTMTLMGSVVLVHGVVIAIYYALHIPDRPMKTQQTFIAVWVVLTLGVVVPQMKGIRKLRRPSGSGRPSWPS